MTSAVSFELRSHLVPPKSFSISEDTLCKKVAASLPLIGILPFAVFESNLGRKLDNCSIKHASNEREIKILHVLNEFKFCVIIGSVLTTAILVVSLFATGVAATLSQMLIVDCLMLYVFASFQAGEILLNKDRIAELKKKHTGISDETVK